MPEAKPYLESFLRMPALQKPRREFLRLDMNENVDGLAPDFVRETFSKIDPDYLASYPDYTGLTRRVAEHNQINPENICLSNGSDGAIKYIFDAYIRHGDTVLLTDPTFAMYQVYCKMFQAKSVMVTYHDDFSFPLEEFLDGLDGDVRLAVIVEPNNPTGVAIGPPSLERVLEKCFANDILLIIDEAYFYYYDKTCIEKIRTFDNIIVLRTFSKLCAMAGLRIGYAVAAIEIILNLHKVKPTYDVNALGALFAERLLDKPEYIEAAIRTVRRGKQFLIEQLQKNKIEFRDGEANFVLIKCPGMVMDIMEALISERILVSGGFRQGFLKDYLRVTVGSISHMQKFCDVFLSLWKKTRLLRD